MKDYDFISLRDRTPLSIKATQSKRREYTAYYAHNIKLDEQRSLIMLIIIS